MPEYLSPGVYVEEVDTGAKPIEGVSTSTAGAVGITERGPTTGKPVLVTSFLQFQREFGGFLPNPPTPLLNRWALDPADGGRWWYFPLSVKGFFDNGGQRLYVRRVASGTATTASLLLARGLISEIVRDASKGATELRLRHTVGIQNGTVLQLFIDGVSVGNVTVASYLAASGLVVLTVPINADLVSGRDFVQIIARAATPNPPPDVRLTVSAKASGDWGGNEVADNGITAGNGVRVRVQAVAGAALKMIASPTVGGLPAVAATADQVAAGATNIPVASAAGFVIGDRVLIKDREYTVNNIASAQFDIAPGAIAPMAAGSVVRKAGQVLTTLTANAAMAATTVRIASATGIANGDVIDIGGNNYTVSNLVVPGRYDIAPGAVGAFAVNAPIQKGGQPRGLVSVAVAIGGTSVTVTNIADVANNDVIDIGGNNYTITNVTALPPVFTLNNAVPVGATWVAGTPIRRMRAVIDTGNPNIINVQNASQLYSGAIVELDTGSNKEVFTVDSIAGDAVTLSGNPAQTYFEDYRLRPIEGEVTAQYRRNSAVVEEETFTNLRFLDDDGPNYIIRQVNDHSKLINLNLPFDSNPPTGADFNGSVSQLSELPIIPAPAVGPQRAWADLAGGRDNLNGLTSDDFVGVEGGSDGSTGIQSLEYIDEISICLAPGMWSANVQSALILHCEILKDRFAIVDPPDGLSIDQIRDFREPIDTKYGALYYPWIEVRDPSVKRNVYVAPSAHMAGIYARVDVERGVHKAPANEVIRGITKIVQDVTKREQDMLNPKGINALRFFPGRGNRVWGARTLSSDASWKYINVRRLFIFVEESIDEGTQFVVFEPNDEPLWARVRQTITNFLTTVWRSGALQGATTGEAFFVKCDHTTMTQDDIDNGKLICVIGIAPVKPAEFVIFRIQQKTIESKS